MSGPLGSSQWMYASGEAAAQQSLKFNDDESQYLSWSPDSAGNRKTWTWSGWVKRGNISSFQGLFASRSALNDASYMYTAFNSSNNFQFSIYSTTLATTSQVFRDTSAWYHIVVAFDATAASAADRLKFYVNGLEADLATDNRSSISNQDYAWNQAGLHFISGRYVNSWSNGFDGYLSDVHFIDGQALDADDFGETVDGYWKAKDYAGTYGTNGFHLTFEDDVVSEGFNTVTYTGNGGSQSVSGLGMAADLVWIKQRTDASNHKLFDSVRGATKELESSTTDAEATQTNMLTSFDADGFTVGNSNAVNGSGDSIVAWAWDAGTGSAASNTDGTITSSVKANPNYGFSIVSYTASGTATDTVGHGLSSAPEVLILKDRDATGDWYVYTTVIDGSYDSLRLNSTNAKGDSGQTAPTNSVFGSGYGSTNDIIAYCFHSVAGCSSIGTYSGNGSTSGPTVTTGFKPAFVMVKNTSDATFGDWHVFDNTRNVPDFQENRLEWNTSDAEAVGSGFFLGNFTDTGFEITNSSSHINQSGSTFIYMAFADTREAAFWKDVSGQGNHWTPNNLDYRDSLIDSPANNFCVMNPLANELNATLSEGNLRVIGTSNEKLIFSTFGVSSGKWYFEAYIENQELRGVVGITDDKGNDGYEYGQNYAQLSTYFGYLSTSATDSGENFSRGCQDGDVISFAIDADNGQVWIKLNSAVNTGSAAFATGLPTDKTYRVFYQDSYTSNTIIKFNFGQDSTFAGATTAGGNQDDNGIGDFKYAPPSGFLALCTSNLPEPTIVDGSEYFNTVLYTGDDSTQAITSVGFDLSTDGGLVWIKNRSVSSTHRLYNSLTYGGPVSAGSSTNYLASNSTIAETASASTIISLDADGFTVHGSGNDTNDLNESYAAWNWKAGGAAVSNTDGSITSQVSANTDAGFSIVSYTGNGVTGATVGHSLGVKPDMFIVKNRTSSGVNDWSVYHSSLTATHRAYLYKTDAAGSTSAWNNTEPTSSVFTIKNFSELNSSGDEYIAYCFANTDGYLKAGSYTGNGNNDGPFVYTGFRPAWVMVKVTSTSSGWLIWDNKRDTYNAMNHTLRPNSNSAEITETTGSIIDATSNGFKIRENNTGLNASGGTYIYLAFAENPFKYATAR